MHAEDKGGECQFDMLTSSKLRLLPVVFGARKTVGNEKHFHSHPGEALAATFGVLKNRHFYMGSAFYFNV